MFRGWIVQQVYDTEGSNEGPGSTLVELLALTIGAGAMLLVLHLFGIMALMQRLIAML